MGVDYCRKAWWMRHGVLVLLLSMLCVASESLLAVQGSPLAANDAHGDGLHLFQQSHPAMGTTFTLQLYADNAQHADEISSEVFDEVDRIEALLSNYRDSSELSRINQLASKGPVTTDPETFRFLNASQQWSERSHGAFDITVGKLMKGWGFFRASGRVPSARELRMLRQETGWQHMKLDPNQREVSFVGADIELDPGGIGKGFAIDAVVKLLLQRGVTAAMISAGSSTIFGLGAPPGQQGWRVDIPDLYGTSHPISTIYLRDTSISSASCTEKHFTLAGHQYCHIMDPATLQPVQGTLFVSVIDRSATASDALSNILFVKGEHNGAEFLSAVPEDGAIIVSGQEQKPLHCTAVRWPTVVRPATKSASRCETIH